MKKILITICFFLFAPSVGFAACGDFVGSGFADSNSNSTFVDRSTSVNGYPSYATSGNIRCLSHGSGGSGDPWFITDCSGTLPNTGGGYYFGAIGNATPDASPYTGNSNSNGFVNPTGNITPDSCGGGGGATSTLPSWIGLPWLIGNATSTQISTTTQVYEISYSVNTTTQEMFNALTDHTQSNLAYGLGIFLIVAGGFLWTLRSRK